MSVTVSFRCPAEDVDIGVLRGEPHNKIDSSAILCGFEAEQGYALTAEAVRDGVQLLCPRCQNPVVISLSDDDGVQVIPGTLRFGVEGQHDGSSTAG